MKRLFNRFFAALLSVTLLTATIGMSTAPAIAASPKHFKISQAEHAEKNAVKIKFSRGSHISLGQDGSFVGDNTAEIAQLNAILTSAKRLKAAKILDQPTTSQTSQLVDRLKNYYTVSFKNNINVDALVNQLNQLSIVEIAYPKAKPAPLPTANYQSLETYLKPAPTGVNADFARTYPGGDGSGVRLLDLEYSWNTSHEDLSCLNNPVINYATPQDPSNDTNHGTAVAGMIGACSNGFGVTGTTPKVNLKMVPLITYKYGWNVPVALYVASMNTKPGDVILVQQQVYGPDGNFVPVEWMPEVYDSIKALTDAGRIVIEPAGNGNQNLDDVDKYGTSFPMGNVSSGAIIVGAGENCDTTNMRSRLYFSNYGSRVNLQGPGNCVVTSGYGDLSGTTANNFYTDNFNGTSSASPLIAAAAASLSSAYLKLNNKVLTPSQIQYILTVTGTAQKSSAVNEHIGPLPDLGKALLTADQTNPNVPTNFNVVLNSSKKPYLSWTAATDNVKVAKYQIFRNNTKIKEVTTLTYTDATITTGTYSYKVRAVDSSGRVSEFTTSKTVSVP